MLRHLVNLLLICLPVSHMFRVRSALLKCAGIVVGEDVKFCGHGWVYGRGQLLIGASTWISPRVVFYTHEDAAIEIGSECDIGHGVVFVPGSHEIGPSSRRAGLGFAKSIRVGRGCWIGAGSVILGGADIGDGVVVAAGSLVRGCVADDTLVAGYASENEAASKIVITRRLYFVCNALDEVTRAKREISSDSPAASKKVFELSSCLRSVGVKSVVVSMGRGKSKFTRNAYAAKTVRAGRAAIVYSWFVEFPGLSQLVSFLSLAWIMIFLPSSAQTAVIFYNRHPAYILALVFARFRGFTCVLDLEDGEVSANGKLNKRSYWSRAVFDWLCKDGALLACEALARMTSIRPTLAFYGTALPRSAYTNWESSTVRVLLGGTLSVDTGAGIFLSALELLRKSDNEARKHLEFHVTGAGESLNELADASSDTRFPRMLIHGRLSNADYNELLGRVEVGLALKLPEGPLATSTFPSKVIEYASARILVITTEVSDVKAVLHPNALFLPHGEPQTLADTLLSIAESTDAAQRIAFAGKEQVVSLLNEVHNGQNLVRFVFGDSNVE